MQRPGGIHTRRSRRLLLFAFCLLILIAAAAYLLLSPPPPVHFPPETSIYVWQRAWAPAVAEAVRRAAPETRQFLVLIGELHLRDGHPRFDPVQVDWQAFADAQAPVTPVLRAESAFAGHLASPETRDAFARAIESAQADARWSGLTPTGFQLDYDCPTARLSEYHGLVKALRQRFPGQTLSITVLPTWLDDRAFAPLARSTDYYVLQVHSLDKPQTIDDPIKLFDASKLPARLDRASALRVPYYVALPTYAYRMAFDADGRFLALAAEGSVPAPRTRTVASEPVELAGIASQLREHPPAYCRGIAWFRLPVYTDSLNWSWPTFQSVMAGRVPETFPEVEIRRPRNNLAEIWINNTAGSVSGRPFQVTVRVRNIEAFDAINGFEATLDRADGSLTLIGPVPEQKEPAMVAWLLIDPNVTIEVGEKQWAP